MSTRVFTMCTLVLTLAACGDKEQPPASTSSAASQPNPSSSPSPSLFDAPLPEAFNPNLEQRHPNGSTMLIKRVEFGPTFIKLSVAAINGTDHAITFAGYRGDGMVLTDDTGAKVRLMRPKANGLLEVKEGASLEGDVVFPARVSAKARTLTLETNGGEDMSERSWSPSFVFKSIAIPGRS